MIPTIGRIVAFRSADKSEMAYPPESAPAEVPAIITRVHGNTDTVNLQVFCDGMKCMAIANVPFIDSDAPSEKRSWRWPVRVDAPAEPSE